MKVIGADEAQFFADQDLQPCDKISVPTHNLEVLAAYRSKHGEVVELVRYTYSQGLRKYMYLVYKAQEVRA
jgi:hypothetical protein